MVKSISQFIHSYSSFKNWLSESYGLAEDLLHVHAGLLIFFGVALLFQRRMRSRVPIAIVYILSIANEVVDAMTPGKPASQWEPLIDILNTVVWPSLLFLLARRQIRQIASDRSGLAAETSSHSADERT